MALTSTTKAYSSITFVNGVSTNLSYDVGSIDYNPDIGDELQVFADNTQLTSGFTINTSLKQILLNEITSNPPTNIVIKRIANKTTRQIDFQNASVLTEADLDNSALQTFHVAQEAIDKAEGALPLNTPGTEWDASISSSAAKITNIADPSANDHAVNKNYLENTWLSTTDKSNITTLTGLSSELGRLGTTDYSSGNDAFLRKLGVDSMSNATTGNIKKVADVATEVGVVGETTYKADVQTVANSTYKAKVETVADSTYKGKVETVAESVYKGKVETVADSTYKTKVEAVAGKETEVGLLGQNAVITDMGILGTNDNVSNMNTVADDITNINAVAGSIAGSQTYTVTVAGGVFVLDGTNNPAITLTKGFTYTFNQTNALNDGHPLLIRDDDDNVYTNGVTYQLNGASATQSDYSNATTFNAGRSSGDRKIIFTVPANAPTTGLRYYCTVHLEGMGNTITTANNDLGTVASIGAANLNTVATNAESNAIEFSIALG